MKCNICGKRISDFATKCPYCNSEICLNENQQNTEISHKLKIRNQVLIPSVLAFGIAAFFCFLISLLSGNSFIASPIETAIKILYVAYMIFLIIKHRMVDMPKDKIFIILSVVAGVLVVLFNIIRTAYLFGIDNVLYGMNFTYQMFSEWGVVTSIVNGVIVIVLMITARFLLKNLKK